MKKIILIRHGATIGNINKRYIGKTDEELCFQGVENIKYKIYKNDYESVKKVISSPMIRCIQTAKMIFKIDDIVIDESLRECDFGEFENKNYIELSNNKNYQQWIDSNGTLPFPKGESIMDFKRRCQNSFYSYMKDSEDKVAFVIHGGTIMSIMEKYAIEDREYYQWRVQNACGYKGEWNGSNIVNITEI